MGQSNYDKTARELVAAGILELRQTGRPTRYPYRERIAELEYTLERIAEAMSGTKWDADTMELVLWAVEGAGYEIKEPCEW